MTRIVRVAAGAGLAIAMLAVATSSLNAADRVGSAREGQAVLITLGDDASALTYWVDGAQGWQVVTTIDTRIGSEGDQEGHAVVRFTALLLPGQEQSISVPVAVGAPQPSLRIRRVADHIEIERNSILSD